MVDFEEKIPNFRILPLVQPNPDGHEIDIQKIKMELRGGLSDCPAEDRCMAWLSVFGVFPKNPNEWPLIRAQILSLYDMLIKEYGVENWLTVIMKKNTRKADINLPYSSVMALIHTDIIRTGRHIFFFPPDPVLVENDTDECLYAFHSTIRKLERILFVFARANENYGYMQGFNELVAPILYVITKAKRLFDGDELECEAITFYLFQNLLTTTSISEYYDTRDKSSQLEQRLEVFHTLFNRLCPKLCSLFDSLGLDPFIYAFRWFNLIFAQEHDLPSLLFLWDNCFSRLEHLSDYILYVAVAHIEEVSSRFTRLEFSVIVEVLQNMQEPNVFNILKEANRLWEIDAKFRNSKKKKK